MMQEEEPAVTAVPQPLNPPADPARFQETAFWLRRIRIGVLFMLAVFIIDEIYWILFSGIGLQPGPHLGNWLTDLRAIIDCVGVWILVSAEPGRRAWLWPTRWILRLQAGAMLVLVVGSLITYSFILPMPGASSFDVNSALTFGILLFLGLYLVLFYWYLRELAQRLGEMDLRKNFSAAFWCVLCALLVTTFILAWAQNIRTTTGTPVTSAPSTSSTAEAPGLVGRWIIAALGSVIYVWQCLLMWLLAWRLNKAAKVYRKLAKAPPEPVG